jgi:hypothetical protein
MVYEGIIFSVMILLTVILYKDKPPTPPSIVGSTLETLENSSILNTETND